MAKERTTRELAQRIDPTYFRRGHFLRRWRYCFSVGLTALCALWIALAALFGNEGVYAAGRVSTAHALFGADCQQCHVDRFSPVRDSSCLPCHNVGSHDPETGSDPACAYCHVEHRGRKRLRASVDDAFCSGCHLEHKGIGSFDDHIEVTTGPRDQHLIFSHHAHLEPDLKQGPLQCASCHQPDDTGGFRPPDFDAHCAKCHTDRVDADTKVAVPHGQPIAELKTWLIQHYLRTMGVPDREKTLPGKGREPPAWRDALLERADTALEGLLRPGAGCLLCHTQTSEKGEIKPPVIPDRWMPNARFNHHKHRSESCASCHDVSRGKSSTELHLPKLLNCRACHHRTGAPQNCITCHLFHR